MADMGQRAYGQYCGLAHALDIVGERWALLIVRDLLVGPRRYTDLRRGLPRIPTNVLSTRLKALEEADVVWRTVLPRPQGSVVYELTDYGRDLDGIVLALGKWGARTMGDPGPDDIVTPDSLVMALRSTFHPDAAATLRAGYELRIGDIVLNAKVDHGILEMGVGPLPDADLIIDGVSGDAGPVLKALFARELTPAQALETGAIRIGGNPGLLAQFVEMFRI